ncbi:hypothetical protein MKX03_006199 [Papaver bracteatum]|nr:hypothetical protein MKX03_006194 [Papaver bracteatum]KAI3873649.1 hypothetical protein MKX03_006199 [Papaver bracteatum]
MTEATSSTSSASGDQRADHMRHIQQVMNGLRLKYPDIDRLDEISRNIHKDGEGLKLKVPNDMLVLVNKTAGWDTPRDLNSAREMYTSVRDGLKDPNFKIEKELEKLKGLSSALGSKCDVFAKECGQLSLKHGDCCQSLVEKLVEQVPRIKDMSGYEDVATRDEKRWIERALRKKGQMVKQGEDCKIHLEGFRKEVKPMAEKVGDAYAQLGNARMLLQTVNEFIHILATTKQHGFNVDKYEKRRKRNTLGSPGNVSREVDMKEIDVSPEADRKAVEVILLELLEKVSGKKRKRNTLGSPGNVSREVDMKEIDVSQEVDMKAVEVILLKLVEKVNGKELESNGGAADREFMKMWHHIVNEFVLFSVFLKSPTD